MIEGKGVFEHTPTEEMQSPNGLTARELQLLGVITDGGPTDSKRLARELGISHHTVRIHIQNILGKMPARNRTHMAVLAIRRQIV